MTQSEVVLDEVRLHPRRALFITLTCKGDVSAFTARRGLTNFFMRLKRGGYDVSEYVVGREFQRRGTLCGAILSLFRRLSLGLSRPRCGTVIEWIRKGVSVRLRKGA